ncbi:MAG: SipW-dependent-type signal peptide-containing protein [Aeromicrobium sp.]
MTTTTTRPATAGASPDRRLLSRRVRAILAGGLVLGIGAAVTLAAWNDSEFATGTFGSGSFGIEGSTNGTAFADHPAEGSAAGLTFEVSAGDLAPEEPVYAGFAVQLAAGSTTAATVDISASSAAAIAPSLTYSVVRTTAFGCTAATFAAGTALVTDAATTASTAADIFTLAAVTTPTNLCFKVTPAASLPQGVAGGPVVWELAAESTTTLP